MKTILLYGALALAVATAMPALAIHRARAHAVAYSGHSNNCVAAANARFTAPVALRGRRLYRRRLQRLLKTETTPMRLIFALLFGFFMISGSAMVIAHSLPHDAYAVVECSTC
jgi:hypothetical protein